MLFLTTRDIGITFISILSVAYIMLSVLTIIVLKGWEMGISESIAIELIIGLSVDYVVHLAAHFVSKDDEEQKLNSEVKELSKD